MSRYSHLAGRSCDYGVATTGEVVTTTTARDHLVYGELFDCPSWWTIGELLLGGRWSITSEMTTEEAKEMLFLLGIVVLFVLVCYSQSRRVYGYAFSEDEFSITGTPSSPLTMRLCCETCHRNCYVDESGWCHECERTHPSCYVATAADQSSRLRYEYEALFRTVAGYKFNRVVAQDRNKIMSCSHFAYSGIALHPCDFRISECLKPERYAFASSGSDVGGVKPTLHKPIIVINQSSHAVLRHNLTHPDHIHTYIHPLDSTAVNPK
jgi:hypothetical protein